MEMAMRVPDLLRQQLGEQPSLALVEMIEDAGEQWRRDVLDRPGERFERRLAEELGMLRLELHESIGTLRLDLLKWSFLFWIGQLAAIAGIMSVMLHDR